MAEFEAARPGLLCDAFVRRAALAIIVGYAAYVGGWAIGGTIRRDYDPFRGAISELFELGAPWSSRGWIVAGLLLSGLALLGFGPALDRGLPGRGRLGPVLVMVAGVFTLLVLASPCSPGCPGRSAAWNDTAHTWTATVVYVTLGLAPLAFAWRLRRLAPALAALSLTMGGVAALGFAVRYLGVLPGPKGLQQRVIHIVADLWYLLLAIRFLRGRSARE
jgi:hypothetical protein